MLRKHLIRVGALGIAAAMHLGAPTSGSASPVESGGCGACRVDCPSIWELDTICHQICSLQSMGWCPAASDECAFWQVRLNCQGHVE